MEKDANPEEQQEQQNNEEEEQTEETEEQSEESSEESGDNLKKTIAIQESLLKREGFEKDENGKWVKKDTQEQPQEESSSEQSEELSQRDLVALIKADVHEDDFDDVQKAANLLGKSVSEALKDDMVQDILKRRVEHRQTAQASNTGAQRPSQKTKTSEEIMREASEGKIPETDEEAEELFWARKGRKLSTG